MYIVLANIHNKEDEVEGEKKYGHRTDVYRNG